MDRNGQENRRSDGAHNIVICPIFCSLSVGQLMEMMMVKPTGSMDSLFQGRFQISNPEATGFLPQRKAVRPISVSPL